jgi:hypothetical protein
MFQSLVEKNVSVKVKGLKKAIVGKLVSVDKRTVVIENNILNTSQIVSVALVDENLCDLHNSVTCRIDGRLCDVPNFDLSKYRCPKVILVEVEILDE